MMATTHRYEEYSSNVIRSLSPTHQRTTNADNNLDYLLEDLQSSVSSPVSYTSSATRDVQYLSPANTTTIVRERSVSPGSETRKVYKTASYKYSTTANDSIASQQNVDQLDILLQDLKTERDITRERDYSHIHTSGIDSGLLEPISIVGSGGGGGGGGVTKTTRVYKSTVSENKPPVQRELIFDSIDDSFSQTSTPKLSPSAYTKKVETKTVRDVSYEPGSTYDIKRTEQRIISPSSAETKAVTLRANELPPELKNVPLSDDILPVPGTKVTTTVRTYTYEIPAEVSAATNKTLLYKNESSSYNSSNTNAVYPERSIPQSVVFKTESYNTVDGGVPGGPSSPHNVPPSNTRTIIHKRDVRETNTSNIYPSPGDDYPSRARSPPPPNSSTYIYKEDVTNTTNTNILPAEPNWDSTRYPPRGGPTSPPRSHSGHPPGQSGPTTTYYYKHESSNTKNTLYGPPSDRSSPYPSPRGEPLTYTPSPNSSLDNRPSHPYPGEPAGPKVTTYKYSSTHSSRTMQGHPSEKEPLLQPAPFPTDGVDHSQTNGNPPKRLDDLMASFNGNAGGVPVDETISRRREVETAVAQSGEPKIPSKNIAGPPVYYPPGHEMFAKKEESSAAWRAQGGYAKASGRYEYEAESKSKTKSRSGAAVVPVCLPLCCAMPCTIM